MKMNSKGQALVEYVLIIGLIAGVAIVATGILGGVIKDTITKSSCDLMGQVYKEGKKAGEGTCVDKE